MKETRRASMARLSLGGEEHRVAPEGVGSSPAVSIKERRKWMLRRMLRSRDKQLAFWDQMRNSRFYSCSNTSINRHFFQLDAERKEIRRLIKYHQPQNEADHEN